MRQDSYLGMRAGDLEGKPYARYWRQDMAPLSDAISQALLQSPYPADYGFSIPDCQQLLQPGYLALENGYTQLANGEMFVAVKTPMPGVSGQMIDWWFGWHSHESQRYKLWHPHAHMKAVLQTPSEDRPDLPDRERYLGNTSYVDEYIGDKILRLAIQFKPPSHFGLTEPALAEAGIQTAVCAEVGPARGPLNIGKLVHLIRETPDGCEMRSRFWLGKVFLRKRSSSHLLNRLLSPSWATRLVMGRKHGHDMVVHCAMEMAHLASFLPSLYRDYHPIAPEQGAEAAELQQPADIG